MRSLLALVKLTRSDHGQVRHTVMALQPGEYLPLTLDLRRQGVRVVRAADPEAVGSRIAAADLVMLHFWNTPRLWRLLTSGLPPARWLVWSKVLGAHAPQLLADRLLAGVQGWALTAPPPARYGERLAQARIIPGFVDHERLAGVVPQAHAGFHVDYVGTTNRGKLHPGFVRMMARLDIPELKVRICGGALDPAMAAELAGTPRPDRFDCLGFVEVIGPILATSDVFAYPLAEHTYASSDKSLQEAMLAGVPPVILPHGGPSRFVSDGENGIVAPDEDAFVAAIEQLHRHPEQRRALGEAARRSARLRFPTGRHAAELMTLAEQVARQPKVPLLAPEVPVDGRPIPAAVLFLMSQGWDWPSAAAAMTAWLDGDGSALDAYAAALDDDAFQVEGGVLHWRKEALDDPVLRAWSARWLAGQGRQDVAAREAAAALSLGAPAAALRLPTP